MEIPAKNNTQNSNQQQVFAQQVRSILSAVLNGENPKVKMRFKGGENAAKKFVKVIMAEKDYIEHATDYGVDAPITMKKRKELAAKIDEFERISGIEWPIG